MSLVLPVFTKKPQNGYHNTKSVEPVAPHYVCNTNSGVQLKLWYLAGMFTVQL